MFQVHVLYSNAWKLLIGSNMIEVFTENNFMSSKTFCGCMSMVYMIYMVGFLGENWAQLLWEYNSNYYFFSFSLYGYLQPLFMLIFQEYRNIVFEICFHKLNLLCVNHRITTVNTVNITEETLIYVFFFFFILLLHPRSFRKMSS